MNLASIMKQASEMQAKMADMQTKLEHLIVQGQSGGGLVKVTMNGKSSVTALNIDPSILKAEDRELIEDLIMAALADAKSKAEAASAEQMASITSGLPLPPGFKLPF